MRTIGAVSGNAIGSVGGAAFGATVCSPGLALAAVCAGAFGWAGGELGTIGGRVIGGQIESSIERIKSGVATADDVVDTIGGLLG